MGAGAPGKVALVPFARLGGLNVKVLVSLLFVAVCLFAVPVAASAATYNVNALGDQVDENPGTGGCKTAGNTCT